MASPARRSRWSASVEIRRPGFRDVPGLALVALIALKLAGVIAWSWWLVLLPLWLGLPGGVVLGLLFIYFAVAKLAEWLGEWWHWRRPERRSDW